MERKFLACRRLSLSCAVGAALLLAGPSVRAADTPFELNIILPLSGGAAFLGNSEKSTIALAESWMELEAARLMTMNAAWAYDSGRPAGAAANAAKYLAAEAGFKACTNAVMTHGGFGYAKEYHVERYLRESLIPRIAPISPQLVLCYIAERVLGLPKSY